MRLWVLVCLLTSGALCLEACHRRRPPVGQRSPLTAYCGATVIGIGPVEVETDYIPHVVNCENGAAGFEALKAQAVAARSYLYYRLDRTGEIGDGTGDQVYSCGRAPSLLAYMAAEATSGQVLMYRGTPVAGFYVAGAKQSPPACREGTSDPTATEPYVTYNDGRSGDAVRQTTLGWVHPQNLANRGAKSQNGAACLSESGRSYDEILRFYYGDDIDLVQARGPCVAALQDEERRTAAAAVSTGCDSAGPDQAFAALMAAVMLFFAIRSGVGHRRRSARRAAMTRARRRSGRSRPGARRRR